MTLDELIHYVNETVKNETISPVYYNMTNTTAPTRNNDASGSYVVIVYLFVALGCVLMLSGLTKFLHYYVTKVRPKKITDNSPI